MERYNYDLIRDRVSRLFRDEDWGKLPFDKSFLDQAICLGAPLYRLRNWVSLQETDGFDADWGREICEVVSGCGEQDADRLDQAVILRSYELQGIDPATKQGVYSPRNYFVLLVHLRNVKMAAISGVTVLDCSRPPMILCQVSFAVAR
jgi:hypothetical protein